MESEQKGRQHIFGNRDYSMQAQVQEGENLSPSAAENVFRKEQHTPAAGDHLSQENGGEGAQCSLAQRPEAPSSAQSQQNTPAQRSCHLTPGVARGLMDIGVRGERGQCVSPMDKVPYLQQSLPAEKGHKNIIKKLKCLEVIPELPFPSICSPFSSRPSDMTHLQVEPGGSVALDEVLDATPLSLQDVLQGPDSLRGKREGAQGLPGTGAQGYGTTHLAGRRGG